MNCGEEIRVLDIYNATTLRFIAQCHDRFLLISHTLQDYRNGYMLADWRGVLRELVALAVPVKLIEKTKRVEGAHAGVYVGFPLTYPLSVKSLADLLSVPADEVRAQLADLAVETDP